MAKRKVRDILIDIGAAYNIDDPSNALAAFSGMFQGIVGINILNNLCKYCNKAMNKAANTYIKNTIIKKLVRQNKNIAWKAAGNEEYRGALGIPKRYTYAKLENWLAKALVIEVRACVGEEKGRNSLLAQIKGSIRQQGTNKASIKNVILGVEEVAKNTQAISLRLDDIVEKAYKASSFRAGRSKRGGGYRRNWLMEADTGEPQFSTPFSVYPGPGEGLGDFSESGEYSRSGTHIMKPGGSYDPNDWRPNPEESNSIRNAFLKGIPGMLQRIKISAAKCLKNRKGQIKRQTQETVDAQKPIQVQAKKAVRTIAAGEGIINAAAKVTANAVDEKDTLDKVFGLGVSTFEEKVSAAIKAAKGFSAKELLRQDVQQSVFKQTQLVLNQINLAKSSGVKIDEETLLKAIIARLG
jgi:hypothetical protein